MGNGRAPEGVLSGRQFYALAVQLSELGGRRCVAELLSADECGLCPTPIPATAKQASQLERCLRVTALGGPAEGLRGPLEISLAEQEAPESKRRADTVAAVSLAKTCLLW